MNTEILQSLLDWNPWLTGDFPEELIGFKRNYDLFPYLEVPEIKIVEGARRVGKSTLLYQLIHQIHKKHKNILYVNFEDEVLSKYPLADIISTYLEHAPIEYLFIDEIQACPDWVQFTRKIYDRKEYNQIWVSGSNATLIKEEYATLLTGRNLPINVFSLSFPEFLIFKSFSPEALSSSLIPTKTKIKYQKLFSEYMEYGAFPAVVNRTVLKKELLLAYFDDFIYKDIVARYEVNANKIKELAIYLATNSCKLFSYRNIATALDCHVNTITDYFNYLKEIFLFEELYKFDFSLSKQYSNDKKVYCLDTGLAAAVSFRFSQDKGRILENIVFNELRRRNHQIYFHKHKKECDFLIKEELKITQAIQVCLELMDADTKNREITGLMDALEKYNLQRGLLLTLSEERIEHVVYDTKTYIIDIKPVWKWLLEPYQSTIKE